MNYKTRFKASPHTTRSPLAMAALVCLGVLAAVGSTSAQPRGDTETSAILARAAEYALAERFDEAIAVWYSVLPKLSGKDLASTQKRLAVALQQTDRLSEAWHFMAAYLASPYGRTDTAIADIVADMEQQLTLTHARIIFSCDPDGLVLTLPPSKPNDDPRLLACKANSGVAWWLRPGRYSVTAEAQGYTKLTVTIDVKSSADTGVKQIRLVKSPKTPPEDPNRIQKDPAGEPAQHKGSESKGSPVEQGRETDEPFSRTLEWSLLGAGLAVTALGGVLNIVGYNNNSDLDDKYGDRTRYPDPNLANAEYDKAYDEQVLPFQISAYALYAIGGAAVVTSGILWLVREPESSATQSAFHVVPLLMPGTAGFDFGIAW